jgi:protein O-GlcNAc transferase
MKCKDGHYRPPNSCFFKHVLVDADGGVSVPLSGDARPDTLKGGSVFDTWNMRRGFVARRDGDGGEDGQKNDGGDNRNGGCAVLTGPVVAFTFYYHYGAGNYYHFVYDTLLPLFALLEAQGWLLPATAGERRVLWPTVEHGSLVGFDEGVDWTTDAFSRRREDGSLPYWHEALVSIFGDDWEVEPLTNATLERRMQQTGPGLDKARRPMPPAYVYCVDELVAGLPKMDFGDVALVSRFVSYVRTQLSLPERRVECADGKDRWKGLRAGFVRRVNRRRVINHEALVSIMGAHVETDVLRLERLSFREQLARMSEYALLVGMQGAGLINALFLPEGAHIIVLFQFNAASDSFAQLLRPRVGSYRRWINQDRKSSVNDPKKDPFHDIADTVVDEEEFEMMLKATLAEMC